MTGGGNSLVRKFVIRNWTDWLAFVAFVRANWELVKEGKAFQIVLSIYKVTRSNEQNRFMWGEGCLGAISDQAWYKGRRYDKNGWNLAFKIMFLPETNAKGMDKWFYPPVGDPQLVMSTSDLNEQEMTLYLTEVCAFATTELGVMLPVNPKDLQGNYP